VESISLEMIAVTLTIVTLYAAVVLLAVRWMLNSTQKHSDEKFKTLFKTLHEASESRIKSETEFTNELKKLEVDIYKFRSELPQQYVMREDFIRVYNVTDHKLDATNLKLSSISEAIERISENQRVKEVSNVDS